jgi:hypothetical protein
MTHLGETAVLMTLVEATVTTVADYEARKALYRPVYYAMLDQDWELDMSAIDGLDPAFDAVVRAYDPSTKAEDIWAMPSAK